ncbi:MAG: hypothetical protein ACR2GG_08370 [Gemmatimonadaceae bacterium]
MAGTMSEKMPGTASGASPMPDGMHSEVHPGQPSSGQPPPPEGPVLVGEKKRTWAVAGLLIGAVLGAALGLALGYGLISCRILAPASASSTIVPAFVAACVLAAIGALVGGLLGTHAEAIEQKQSAAMSLSMHPRSHLRPCRCRQD